jgi:two-component system LytT family response regulator
VAALRTLIVDDEPLARSGLRLMLRRHADVEVVGESGNGFEAVEAIQELRPDLVFLDVQMPGLDGFGVIEALGSAAMPAVVFVTAFDHYALQAFRVHAVDYLLKPVESRTFQEALAKARARLSGGMGEEVRRQLEALLGDYRAARSADGADAATPTPLRYLQRLSIKDNGRVFFLKMEQIDWFEAADNYVKVHAAGKVHFVRTTMSEMETRLDPAHFARIHRRTIVNLERVKVIHTLFKGDYMVVLNDSTELKLSRGYRDRILDDGV